MSHQIELIKGLQDSEWRKFQTVSELYSESTENPLGLRFFNIHHAFNVVASSKFIGWPTGFDRPAFFDSVSELLDDYVCGSYVNELEAGYQIELKDSQQSEDWFDYVRLGLYLAFAGRMDASILKLSNWVRAGMKADPGMVDVSPALNHTYETLCSLLRQDEMSTASALKVKTTSPSASDRLLSEMVNALAGKNQIAFVDALSAFDGRWRPEQKYAVLAEIISLDASVLYGVWLFTTGEPLPNFGCVYLPEVSA